VMYGRFEKFTKYHSVSMLRRALGEWTITYCVGL
jgi:hypothetical protein